MTTAPSTKRRVLIWGKTYPELSWKHDETVCTGGSFEDGTPVRVYPVRLRYLPVQEQYSLYDWVELALAPSKGDSRPESHRLADPTIRVLQHLGTGKGWYDRRRFIFANKSWHYGCVDDLKAAERTSKTSLGLVGVREVTKVMREERPAADRLAHENKLRELQARMDLFKTQPVRGLEFYPYKIRLEWACVSAQCRGGHTATVMDWGLGELARRDGIDKAVARMEDLADTSRYDLQLYMGNIKAHPKAFGIVGLWYPLRREVDNYPLMPELAL